MHLNTCYQNTKWFFSPVPFQLLSVRRMRDLKAIPMTEQKAKTWKGRHESKHCDRNLRISYNRVDFGRSRELARKVKAFKMEQESNSRLGKWVVTSNMRQSASWEKRPFRIHYRLLVLSHMCYSGLTLLFDLQTGK